MDYELLVTSQIEEGRSLIIELTRERSIDVEVAFWLKASEVGYWALFIGTSSFSSMATIEVYDSIFSAIRRLDLSSIKLTDVRAVPLVSSYAQEVINICDRHPAYLPVRLGAMTLGTLAIDEAYIYPRAIGPMSRDQVVQTLAALMSRTGAFAPSSITLKDGSSLKAVPTSIQLGVPGELRIVLHDIDGNTDRNVSADDVVSIH